MLPFWSVHFSLNLWEVWFVSGLLSEFSQVMLQFIYFTVTDSWEEIKWDPLKEGDILAHCFGFQ